MNKEQTTSTKPYSVEDSEEGKVYSAPDLNFRPEKQCNHKFKRVASNRVECVKCHIGFFDTGDFPLEELNSYYNRNIDLE